jgi:2,3-bisphosphoglycerate-dependent phosphoglycerate mutase
MDLFLIRHGQSQADLLDVHEGRADFPLTELGMQQAKAMAEWMHGGYTLDRIYSSTLLRAEQTAVILAGKYGLEPVFEADLMERDNGLLAGMDHKKAELIYPQTEALPVHRALYHMEPLLDFRCRAERVLSKILEECTGLKAVAVVSHGGMINRLCHCLLRLPLESDAVFYTGDTGIHGWRLKDGRRAVLFSNQTNHLHK